MSKKIFEGIMILIKVFAHKSCKPDISNLKKKHDFTHLIVTVSNTYMLIIYPYLSTYGFIIRHKAEMMFHQTSEYIMIRVFVP